MTLRTMTHLLRKTCLALAVFGAVGSANATVITAADVTVAANTYGAYQDNTTHLTWLQIDNFWSGATYNSLTSALSGSGFHLASLAELLTLQASMPATPATFAYDTHVVGGNYFGNAAPGVDRNLIWGIYEDGDANNGVSYSWKYDSDTTWQYGSNVIARTAVLGDANSTNRDLGAWVVSNSAAVPEPASLTLAGLALAGLTLTRRSRRQQEGGASRAAA